MNKFFKRYLIATLLFPLILIFIIISMIGNSSGDNGGEGLGNVIVSENISPDVLKWRPLVEKYAKQFGIPDYVSLILAMIQQESGGNTSLDVMQSAEGAFNTRYPKVQNGILDPDYSVWCGVQEVKEALTKAGVTSANDIPKISLALQTYNFGTEFLNFANSKGGYSQAIAQEFSNIWAKKSGWTSYGDPLYVPHVLRYYATATPKSNIELLNKVVEEAKKHLNAPYVWGAQGPNTFDCSGLVAFCYNQAGFKHERTTAQGYYEMCEKITTPEVGDLVFFRIPGDPQGCHHIGIYVGNNKMIHAPKTGDVVKISEYASRSDFIGYGRLKQ